MYIECLYPLIFAGMARSYRVYLIDRLFWKCHVGFSRHLRIFP